MGIQYLTTFISKRFDGWTKSPVKDKLIIDGHSLSYALLEYCSNGPRNEIYGGDYVSIARQMDNFFNTLLKAGVNPLVVLDGINPDGKADTIAHRRKGKLENVVHLFDDETVPTKQPPVRNRIRPYLFLNAMTDSVKRVLGDDHLFVADSDADVDIACLAIHHQCPVLSDDSDFYIFPLLYGYIPYSKFHWGDAKSNVIYGEFYSYDLFCEQFGIRDPSLLTIIPVIVGNDTITKLNGDILKMIMPDDCNVGDVIENAVRYVTTFSTFDSCLTSLRRYKLFGMIKSIQGAYHDYFFLPLFKPRNSLATSLCCKDGSPLPEFILKLHRKGFRFTFAINALRVHKANFSVVVEDILHESWCRLIGVPIRRVIYGILCGSDACILETQRCKCEASYEKVKIRSNTHVTYDGRQIPLPTLESCGTEVDKEYGKKILFGVLKAKKEDFVNVPQDYHLILVITQYWYTHCTIHKKCVFLEAFLLLLLISKEDETRRGHILRSLKDKPQQHPFRIASFAHAFAQWQTVYHDIQPLNELLQVPLKLLPISDFLECSYLCHLVEDVMEKGILNRVDHFHLSHNAYQTFFMVTSQAQ